MADFQTAVRWTLAKEGGYVDDPADSGGPTNLGITLATLREALGKAADFDLDGDVDADDVRLLPRETAERIYRERYWDRPGFGRIPSDRVAAKVFDFGVNAHPRPAIVLLQRAIDHSLPPGFPPVRDDGVLGPVTLAALAQCDTDVVLRTFASLQEGFYLRCVELKPVKRKFLRGWIKRARWIPAPTT